MEQIKRHSTQDIYFLGAQDVRRVFISAEGIFNGINIHRGGIPLMVFKTHSQEAHLFQSSRLFSNFLNICIIRISYVFKVFSVLKYLYMKYVDNKIFHACNIMT